MEQEIEKIEDKNKQKENVQTKRKFTILGYSIWRLLAYFVIYSIVGYIIETLFGMVTKGVIESRKSFLYGPFCAIYGVGAVVMIVFLEYFKKNNNTLFFGGFFIGSVVEYLVSLFGEMMLHVKWWDYSNIPLNINGRVCVFFSLFWGFLAIYLMTYFNPKMDKLIAFIKEKIKNAKLLKGITLGVVIFMFVDCCITGVALRFFFTRLVINYNLEVQEVESYLLDYEAYYENPKMKQFVDKYWGDEKMLKTFPNLKLTATNGDIIYVCDVLKDIQAYYIRIFIPKIPKLPENQYITQ